MVTYTLINCNLHKLPKSWADNITYSYEYMVYRRTFWETIVKPSGNWCVDVTFNEHIDLGSFLPFCQKLRVWQYSISNYCVVDIGNIDFYQKRRGQWCKLK